MAALVAIDRAVGCLLGLWGLFKGSGEMKAAGIAEDLEEQLFMDELEASMASSPLTRPGSFRCEQGTLTRNSTSRSRREKVNLQPLNSEPIKLKFQAIPEPRRN